MLDAFKATFKGVDTVKVTCNAQGRLLQGVHHLGRRLLTQTVKLDYVVEKTVQDSEKEDEARKLLQELQAQTPQKLQTAIVAELQKIAPAKAAAAAMTFKVEEVTAPASVEFVDPVTGASEGLLTTTTQAAKGILIEADTEDKDDPFPVLYIALIAAGGGLLLVCCIIIGRVLMLRKRPAAPSTAEQGLPDDNRQSTNAVSIAAQSSEEQSPPSPAVVAPVIEAPPPPVQQQPVDEGPPEEEFPEEGKTVYLQGDKVEFLSESQWLYGRIKSFARKTDGSPIYSVETSDATVRNLELSCLRRPVSGMASVWEDNAWQPARVEFVVGPNKTFYKVVDSNSNMTLTSDCVRPRYSEGDFVEVFLEGAWQFAIVKTCERSEGDPASFWEKLTVQPTSVELVVGHQSGMVPVQAWQVRLEKTVIL
eukprot:TRINITY_DN47329_c0_g1_i1.p1 TRINITY_DN47329_c0_g1~~TRINITY_DN47329_c0_g1_i1.p1  ORF type:complete len:467 (+),score=110.45 TRINITY_DN47329_c0_g1_i1:139-1401(+)